MLCPPPPILYAYFAPCAYGIACMSTGYPICVLFISVPFEHSVHTVNYSAAVLKVRQPLEVARIGAQVITRRHLCKWQQSIQLKVADSLLKPPWNNSRRGRNVQTELKSTVWALDLPHMHTGQDWLKKKFLIEMLLAMQLSRRGL